MSRKALIFGSIGTLVETSQMQLDAFNQAFVEADLDWVWTRQIYIPMLAQSGGRKRIQAYADDRQEEVDARALHERKTEIFDQMMMEKGLCLRPGVLPLIRYGKDNGMQLGFATTTSRHNIMSMFEALEGALHRSTFDFVGDVDQVNAPKPAPEIYERAMSAFNLTAAECLAIEDTPIAMKAALDAGIECVGFPNAFSNPAEFKGALHVVDTVDPKGLPELAET
ncbi:MAG: HAD-IA family hydrolase [Pseudomonadota bacterium]